MNIRVRQEGSVILLHLEGTIDINSAILIETTGQLVRQGHLKILCDFKDIGRVDYEGLSVLAVAYQNVVNRNGMMKFCNVPAYVKELFKTGNFDAMFDVYDDANAAMRAFDTVSKIDKLYLRRRFNRLELHIPVMFSVPSDPQSKPVRGRMLNISGAGVFIYTKHLLPLSTRINLEIKLENGKTHKLEGTVIWIADKDMQPRCYPGMGVQFTNLNPDDQKGIIDFIEKNITHRSNI